MFSFPTDKQLNQLTDALLDAFEHRALTWLVDRKLQLDLEWIVPAAEQPDLVTIVKNLVAYFASQEDGLNRLLAAALETCSSNDELKMLASEWTELEFAPIELLDEHPHQAIIMGDQVGRDKIGQGKIERGQHNIGEVKGSSVSGSGHVGGDNIARDKNTIGSIGGQAVVAVGDRAKINVSHYHVQNPEEAQVLQQKLNEQEDLLTGSFNRLPFEPETVLIPEGPFLMGSDSSERFPISETSQETVTLSDFRMGKYPVTNREYAAYIQAMRLIVPPELGWDGQSPPAERLDHPVVGVTFAEAVDYCVWLSGETGRTYELPTEAHWEKAARTDDGRTYPWGHTWQDDRCNHGGCCLCAAE